MKRLYLFLIIAALAFGQEVELVTLENGGFSIQVNPYNGDFAIGTEDGIPLTYGHGEDWLSDSVPDFTHETSYISFNMGGIIYARDNLFGDYSLYPYTRETHIAIDSTSITTEWELPGPGGLTDVEQTFTPVIKDGDPAVEIKYTVTNGSIVPIEVGTFLHLRLAGELPLPNDYTNYFLADTADKPENVSLPVMTTGLPMDSIVTRTWLDTDPIPEWLMVGEYTRGPEYWTSGIYIHAWEIYPYEMWEEPVINPGTGLRWDRVMLFSDSTLEYTAYLSYERPAGECLTLSYETTPIGFADCMPDTEGEIRLLLEAAPTYTSEGAVVEVDFSGLPITSSSGMSYLTLSAESDTVSIPYTFPADTLAFGPFDMSVPVRAYFPGSLCDTAYVEIPLYLPHFEGLPPVLGMEISGDTLYTFCVDGDSTLDLLSSEITIATDDTIWHIGHYEWIVSHRGGRLVMPIHAEYSSPVTGHYYPVYGMAEICATIPDYFGCPATICTTVNMNEYSIEQFDGWNLLSIPVVDSVNVASFFTDFIPPAFYHEPGGLPYSVSHVHPGKGFWLLGTENDTIPYNLYAPADSVYWHLYPGWNIVGGPATAVLFRDIPLGDAVEYALYGYIGGHRIYMEEDFLIPGRGYFVFAYEEWEGWVR